MGLFSSDDVEENVTQAIDQAKKQREGSGSEEIKEKQQKVEKATQDAESLSKEVDRIKDGVEALRSQQKLIQERNENLYRALDVIKQEIEKEKEKTDIDFDDPEEVKDQVSRLSKQVKDTSELEEKVSKLENQIDDIGNVSQDLDSLDTEELDEAIEKSLESKIETLQMDIGVVESQVERELTDIREEMDLKLKQSENELRESFARRTEVQSLWDAIESQELEDNDISREKLKEDIKEEIQSEIKDEEYVEKSEFEELRHNVKEMSDLVVKMAKDVFN